MAASLAPRVLIADDQRDVLDALKILLRGEGFDPETVDSPGALLKAVEDEDFDVVLMDMNYTRDTTSGAEGMDLLTRVGLIDHSLPLVVMTAWGSVEGAVEAMRRGAKDYIEKPWDNARLIATLKTQIELGRALRRSELLEEENRHLKRGKLPVLIAESKAMQPVLEIMERIAPSDANILITGEHGTGKEVAARWIHAASQRSDRALVTVNAGGLPEGVFESEIFGHVKGAFTDAKTDRVGCFELADQGTLFLDEIANVRIQQQAKLLRVLETGELQRVGSSKMRRVDVRVISATNADLSEHMEEGNFREDLLYRLNTVEINLPPLRERREDIPLLADHYLALHAERYRKSGLKFSEESEQVMAEHGWPGNVREMSHAVERGVLMAKGDTVQADDLGLKSRSEGSAELEQMTLDDAEKYLIEQALERFDSNVSQAADSLGLSRSALYRRMQRYGL